MRFAFVLCLLSAVGIAAEVRSDEIEAFSLAEGAALVTPSSLLWDCSVARVGKERQQLQLLRHSDLSPEDWTQLQGVKQIYTVRVSGPVTEDLVKKIASLRGVEHIVCDGHTSAGLKAAVELMPKLHGFHSHIASEDLKVMRAWQDLQVLRLGSVKLTTADLDWIGGQKNLQSLSLGLCELPPTTISVISNLSQLQNLGVNNHRCEPEQFLLLTNLRKLHGLALENTSVDDRFSETVLNFPQLETLNVSGTRVTDVFIHACGKLDQLQTLHCDRTAIDGSGFKSWIRENKREFSLSFYLEDTHLNDQGLRLIGSLGPIEALNLSGTRVTKFGLEFFPLRPELQFMALKRLYDCRDSAKRISECYKENGFSKVRILY